MTAAGALDVNSFIGSYPFRHVPHPEPEVLVRVLEREGLRGAWVGHLGAPFHRDPSPANRELVTLLAPHRGILRHAPAVRPNWPGWEHELERAIDSGAPALRAYPPHWGLSPDSAAMLELGHACAERGCPLLLTVRFEDLRQRSALDVAGDLQPAAVRELVRRSPASVIVTAAGRDFIEEVHWGLTPQEQQRVTWEISWIWGPPEDHLAHLIRTVGADRFVYGSGWPLRLVQAPLANLALLPDELRGVRLRDPDSLVAARGR